MTTHTVDHSQNPLVAGPDTLPDLLSIVDTLSNVVASLELLSRVSESAFVMGEIQSSRSATYGLNLQIETILSAARQAHDATARIAKST